MLRIFKTLSLVFVISILLTAKMQAAEETPFDRALANSQSGKFIVGFLTLAPDGNTYYQATILPFSIFLDFFFKNTYQQIKRFADVDGNRVNFYLNSAGLLFLDTLKSTLIDLYTRDPINSGFMGMIVGNWRQWEKVDE